MGLVTVERRGGTAVVAYANPPFGTMTAAGAQEMLEAIRPLVADPQVRSIVLTGGLPGIFIRHYDVDELFAMSEALQGAPPRPASNERPSSGFLALADLIAEAPKPVVAAINGLCMGGGFELALACDLRIASPAVAAIGLPETRIGIFPGGGGTQRLPRVVGEAKALEIILRGLTFTGEEAHRIGLVHELHADPLGRALEIAGEWEGRGAEGIAYAKRLTRAALDRPTWDGLADERHAFLEVMAQPSAREGLASGRRPAEIQKV
ncbi:enoyl-CoA hydratase [Phenylobacterium soli]|uniref:Enoyl-CoA hydratase n=1 Tax=Phenylobacterium soli TaxID=2170551 RepID=A0A328AFC9_9CAUL|nr:enoyl-CoA hydratase [Phenylobacterium soli]